MQAYICECTTGQDFTMHMHVIDILPSKTVVHIKLFEIIYFTAGEKNKSGLNLVLL